MYIHIHVCVRVHVFSRHHVPGGNGPRWTRPDTIRRDPGPGCAHRAHAVHAVPRPNAVPRDAVNPSSAGTAMHVASLPIVAPRVATNPDAAGTVMHVVPRPNVVTWPAVNPGSAGIEMHVRHGGERTRETGEGSHAHRRR